MATTKRSNDERLPSQQSLGPADSFSDGPVQVSI
jgi:hypothetical protein